MDLLNKLNNNIVDVSVWSKELSEPFMAENESRMDTNYLHTHEIFIVGPNKLPQRAKNIGATENIIEDVMFLYSNDSLDKFEDSYWMCIGKTKPNRSNNKHYYFMYESGCCGSGFGLGSTSKLYLADTLVDIVEYALTDKHRTLITNGN